MATIKLTILVAFLAVAAAFPPEAQPKARNTIFGDERLEGEVFEFVDQRVFSPEREISTRNDDNPYRLPTTTKPNRYTVLWATDFPNFAIGGTVAIELEATQDGVNEIVIQSEDLIINSAVLTEGENQIAINVVEQPEYQFLRIQLQNTNLVYNPNSPIVYVLTINFEGEMRTDMYGIYRSWFSSNGTTHWMATTQYQATAGRRAFPCYDEPSFKAYFDITLRRPTTHRSWSCTKIANTTTSNIVGYEEDIFLTTPYMSTYLIAVIVAEYDSLEVFDANGELIYEVIARPDAINDGQGQYALDVGQELLAEMSDHTGIDFYSVTPNLKMTQAAIPDFSAGAMENWGLLTYREAYILHDEEHTSGYFKQLIAYILSHEIAHMWFGNLVTCDWWDVLWLNEGFARYYQYFLTHWIEDYMGLETRFIIEQIHTSLLTDSADNPQPLSNPGVGSPAEVSAMFSTISYNKGAAVIRMTEHLLGFEVHRQGLRNYLATNYYNTALPIDLFNALQDVAVSSGAIEEYGSNFNIIDYYNSWTEQPGHPVLEVHVNHATGDMTIQQRRFNINYGYSPLNTNYIIPITFATASNPDFANTKPTHVLSDVVTVVNRGSIGDEWVIFNKQQTGFYRVNYDDYTWDLIILALRGPQRTAIHEYNRAQIVNDVFQFARSGLMTYTRAMNILSFLQYETEYAPWVAALTGFSWMRNRLAGTAQLDDLNARIVTWATPLMNDLGYEAGANDSFMRLYLRWQMAPVMCNMGVAACQQAAVNQFAALRNNGIEVHKDNRNFVYCNALRQGTVEDFDFLWNRFQNSNLYTEKITILMTAGCTPHQASLETFLDAIVLENELVRPQDYTTAWSTAVSGNEANTQLVFQYVQANMPNVTAAFSSIATPLSYISARLRSIAEVEAFQAWATENQAELGAAYATVFNGAEASRQSIQWAAEIQADLNEYIVNGDDDIAATEAPAVETEEETTEPQPILVEPETPNTDAASTTFLSFAVVACAMIAKFIY